MKLGKVNKVRKKTGGAETQISQLCVGIMQTERYLETINKFLTTQLTGMFFKKQLV
jgi:hypothetical protein